MRCPVCNGDVKVMDSASNANAVVRRRKCLNCNHIFYTNETIFDNVLGAPLLEKFKSNNRVNS